MAITVTQTAAPGGGARGLLDRVKFGYWGNPCQDPRGSAGWIAHQLGTYLHSSGRTIPSHVRKLKLDRFEVNDMLFEYTLKHDRIAFERIS